MSLRDLVRLSPDHLRRKCANAWAVLVRKHKRFRLLVRLNSLYRHRGHFNEQVREGLAGMAWADKQIALTESALKQYE